MKTALMYDPSKWQHARSSQDFRYAPRELASARWLGQISTYAWGHDSMDELNVIVMPLRAELK